MLDETMDGMKNDEGGPLATRAAFVSLCRATDIFVYISTFLDPASFRSLCVTSVKLKEEKFLYGNISLNRHHSLKYYREPDFCLSVQQCVSSPQRQLSLDLSNYEQEVVDVSALGNVHALNLSGCDQVVDVSALGNVHTLNLSKCRRVVDVSSLGNVHSLDLSNCPGLVDVSALGSVHTLSLFNCQGVMDVSALGNVHSLDLTECHGIVDLSIFRELIMSDDWKRNFTATQHFRKLLSTENDQQIDLVIQLGLVPRFVQFLHMDSHPSLQFEAAWALTNITGGTSEDTRFVIDAGALPVFTRLLGSPNEDVREQAVWALGNIAGDGVDNRDLVLSLNALPALARGLTQSLDEKNSRLSTVRNMVWTISNMCRGKPTPPLEAVACALPILSRVLFFQDTETVASACWALSYITDGDNDRIQAVLDHTNVASRLVQLLDGSYSAAQSPALRTVANIAGGNSTHTQVIVDLNALPVLCRLLDHPKDRIRRDACFTISNITAGTQSQIQKAIEAGAVLKVVGLISRRGEHLAIKKEAVCALFNLASCGTLEQIMHLVEAEAVPALCGLLLVPDVVEVCAVALETLGCILDRLSLLPSGLKSVRWIIWECGGLAAINMEEIKSHHEPTIREKAQYILKTYFAEVEGLSS